MVRASKDATIAVDDKVVGTGSFSGAIASGGHSLRVTAPKMVTYRTEIVVQDNQLREVGVTLEAEPSKGLPVWALVAGGVVAASGIGLGAYFIAKGSGDTGASYHGPDGSIGTVQASRPIRF